MIDKLSTVRAENEGLKMKELMPILATEWKELSEKDKKVRCFSNSYYRNNI